MGRDANETGTSGASLLAVDDVPTRRADEATRPNPVVRESLGPSPEDFARLEAGQGGALCLMERYLVQRWLSRGGMASIYVGEEIATGRPVAIKVLEEHGECAHHTLLRFVREASLGEQIRHPNVVEVIDWGTTPEGVMYVVMELLSGEDLRTLADRERSLEWSRVRGLMLQLCAGVGAVHRAGVVHRDLKPANCFLVHDALGERLVLVDFGIAIPAEVRRTQPGDSAIIGTPEFMAPEQARGDRVSERSDVYSAGIILAELLTGQTPFGGMPSAAILAAHADAHSDPMRKLDPVMSALNPALGRVYARATAKDPRDRFESMEALATALEAIPVSSAVGRRERSSRGRGGGGVEALVAVILGLLALS